MQPSERLKKAIETANKFGRFYCKFVSANDVNLTKAHQEGIYIAKSAWSIFFEAEGQKGENKDRFVKMHMDEYSPFDSRLIYYGKGTRNEYRITRFWTNSPWEKEEQVGNLLIFIKADFDNYYCYMLDQEEEIETFISTYSLSLVNNNAVYGTDTEESISSMEQHIKQEVLAFGAKHTESFPDTIVLAEMAREIFGKYNREALLNPDKALLKWIDLEYDLFREIERNIYQPYLTKPFNELDLLFEFANSALNRRKSRAGRSLEHHIDFILTQFAIPFSHPGRTEGKKKPDFILPSNASYGNLLYDEKNLTFLGAKTTCKDRWRQILNEANRIPEKHLLTLQQGITKNQMEEMQDEKVILVVPKPYHTYYPVEYQDRLLSINTFVQYLKEKYTV
ncbi:type II restriction endonuclease [Bacillus paranthracis]|uniref:type II restriction endonuclease n=1 Tax=Bacillus paranthracis TaxID=2026186 RepID=UPI00298D3E17|nr:type II restriction endonuclease [Bacillus paranthracis]